MEKNKISFLIYYREIHSQEVHRKLEPWISGPYGKKGMMAKNASYLPIFAFVLLYTSYHFKDHIALLEVTLGNWERIVPHALEQNTHTCLHCPLDSGDCDIGAGEKSPNF